jgi:hypothetical protein
VTDGLGPTKDNEGNRTKTRGREPGQTKVTLKRARLSGMLIRDAHQQSPIFRTPAYTGRPSAATFLGRPRCAQPSCIAYRVPRW